MRLQRIRYINYRREFPNMSKGAFTKWFDVTRRWGGKLIYISVKHRTLVLDFRDDIAGDLMRHARPS